MTFKKYKRLVDSIKPDMDGYQELKANLGEESFYRGADSLVHHRLDNVVKPEKVEAMVKDLDTQVQKRKEFSRRRRLDPSREKVDYINERNRVYNRQVARAFDPYTEEIRESLERGTAL